MENDEDKEIYETFIDYVNKLEDDDDNMESMGYSGKCSNGRLFRHVLFDY